MRTCDTTGMEFLLEPKDGAGLGQDAGVMSLGKYTVMFQTEVFARAMCGAKFLLQLFERYCNSV